MNIDNPEEKTSRTTPKKGQKVNVGRRLKRFRETRHRDLADRRPSERDVQTLRVEVSNNSAKRVLFELNATAALHSSRLLRQLHSSKADDIIRLESEDPDIFSLFADWLSSRDSPIPYSAGNYSQEPWLSKSHLAWFLARTLKSLEFEKYALSQFIQNCSIAPFGPWHVIERDAAEGTSLKRFSTYWVAWNSYLAGGDGAMHEYVGLRASYLSSLITVQTRDPRKLYMDHWFESCGGNLNYTCRHDPVLESARMFATEQRGQREARELEAQIEGEVGREVEERKSNIGRQESEPVECKQQ